ncbi:hypothetical protein BKA70DRAFT_1233051 [Coprinopsis sp. MPI-PUGE-AT-0042]|nr:hypothetical protein BKA70DRAFT_1233051 [Coprinopsis sp. MPI-PUGE-AT-0042]
MPLTSPAPAAQFNSSRLSSTQPSTNIRLQPSSLTTHPVLLFCSTLQLLFRNRFFAPSVKQPTFRPVAATQEAYASRMVFVWEGTAGESSLGGSFEPLYAPRKCRPRYSQEYPLQVPRLQREEDIGFLLRLFESLISILFVLHGWHQVHYVQSMGYRWYLPQLIVRHWQVTIAPQRRATMKIPPVWSIDVQACKPLFTRHTISSVNMALALAHRIVALLGKVAEPAFLVGPITSVGDGDCVIYNNLAASAVGPLATFARLPRPPCSPRERFCTGPCPTRRATFPLAHHQCPPQPISERGLEESKREKYLRDSNPALPPIRDVRERGLLGRHQPVRQNVQDQLFHRRSFGPHDPISIWVA